RLHAARDVTGLFAPADALAKTSIAAQFGKAGDHEVAEAAQAGESFELSAAGDSKAAHLDGRARYQRGFRIIAEAQAIAHAGGNGDDILQRATHLDAKHIAAGVNAKSRATE